MLPDPSQTAALLRDLIGAAPVTAVVLGSGFGSVVDILEGSVRVPMARLPGFPPVQVKGHAGEAIFGKVGGVPLLLLAGRAHFYEGLSLAQVTFPVRVIASLGVQNLLITNAAGGINPLYEPGDFMVFADHINFMGTNPLVGADREATRFLDLTETYHPAFRRSLCAAGEAAGVRVHEGVYIGVSGPCYETPAEIRAFRAWGADAVGMSSVPEAIVARHCGLQIAALSCITNKAAGMAASAALNHAEVLARGQGAGASACKLVRAFVNASFL